jgi:Tol biopolymer transport system component
MHTATLIAANGSANRRLHISLVGRAPLSWAPDSKRLAYVAGERGTFAIASLDVDTGASVSLAPGWAEAAAPRWSPDGQSLAFEARRQSEPVRNLYVLALGTKHLQQLTQGFASQWSSWRSGEGGQLYWLSNATATGAVSLFREDLSGVRVPLVTVDPRREVQFSWPQQSPVGIFANGGTVWLLSPAAAAKQLLQTDYATSAALSPLGDRLVYVMWKTRQPALVLRTLADGTERTLLGPPDAGLAYTKLAWSPGGQEIAFVRGASLCKLGLTDGVASAVWEPRSEEDPGVLLPPVWSPDSRHLVCGRFLMQNDAQRLEIRVMDADGQHGTVVAASEVVAEHGWLADPLSLPYAWAPDSRRLACCGELAGAPALYTVAPEAPPVLLQRWAAYPEWSADGQTISYTSLLGNRETLAQVRVPAALPATPARFRDGGG